MCKTGKLATVFTREKMATQFNMAWGHINIKIVVPTIFCKNYQNVFKVRIKGKSKTMAY